MKKILLLGDSIRFGAPNSPGYGVYVAEMLKERATVYAPDENSVYVARSAVLENVKKEDEK